MVRSPHVLITGATGAVGPRVVTALHDAGYRIRTLSIDSPPDGVWPEGVEARIGDITDPAAVQSAVQDVDGVIHLAALLHIVNPPPELQEKYERINVGGTATVVEAARQAGVGRLVFFSTIAVYGASAGDVLTEDSPPHPDSFYAQTKIDAERIVLAAKREDGEPLGTVLRLGAVYGARIKGNYQRLLLALARSRFLPIGRGDNRRTLVHDKDVARAAVLVLEHPEATGKIFNVSDGEFHTLNDIISTICQALGKRAPDLSLPIGPVRFAAGIVEGAARLTGFSPPIVRATIDKYTEDIAVDSRRIQKELGFRPLYDLAAGWKETVQEMRRTGAL
jgi:nucleoside-diphosphate-sugar epimerase